MAEKFLINENYKIKKLNYKKHEENYTKAPHNQIIQNQQ